MAHMPRENAIDSTLALLRDPYRYIGRRCDRFGSDLFEARILLRRTVCMRGADAAQLFYDPRRFQRAGAAPRALRATLFGEGGVQTLDGAAHRLRKAMFVALLGPEPVAQLANEVAEAWREAVDDWQRRHQVALYDGVQRLLVRAACRWAGVPLPPPDVALRTRQLVSLFDDAGSLHHLRARHMRARAEDWLSRLIDDVRARRVQSSSPCALDTVAHFRDVDGRLLPSRVAAVELLNLLRPIVAVSVFVVFVAHALHHFPQCLATLQGGDERYMDAFVREVRRYYPFFPAVAARAREEFEWRGHGFRQGQRVLLDLYSTNHDERQWHRPDDFRPERFHEEPVTPFNFVPQGGADAVSQHRCPGEAATEAVMKVSIDWLARRLGYEVPTQDLAIDFGRLPAVPRSHFVLRDVTAVPVRGWRGLVLSPMTPSG
jgi:fatty-acid peroxygenase